MRALGKLEKIIFEKPSRLVAEFYFCRTLDTELLMVYTLVNRGGKMKSQRLTTEQAVKVFESFNRSFYWLQVLVNTGNISKGQAGYIISKGGYNV